MKTPEIDKNTALTVLLIGAVIFLFVAGKGILKSLGLVKTEAQQEAEELKKNSGNPDSTKITLTQSQAVNIAESIYNALKFSSLDDDKPEAIRLIKTAQNNDDFLLIQKAFGERREYFLGLPTGGLKSLAAFMSDNFNSSQKASLKTDFQNKGIKTIF